MTKSARGHESHVIRVILEILYGSAQESSELSQHPASVNWTLFAIETIAVSSGKKYSYSSRIRHEGSIYRSNDD